MAIEAEAKDDFGKQLDEQQRLFRDTLMAYQGGDGWSRDDIVSELRTVRYEALRGTNIGPAVYRLPEVFRPIVVELIRLDKEIAASAPAQADNSNEITIDWAPSLTTKNENGLTMFEQAVLDKIVGDPTYPKIRTLEAFNRLAGHYVEVGEMFIIKLRQYVRGEINEEDLPPELRELGNYLKARKK